jgi:4-amino-4-deoxy-L-arabinose transferase-like glycosyltransferase
MVLSGDWVDIRFQEEVRYRKPVGIYWAQAAVVSAAALLGLPNATTSIWLYRVPPLSGAVGAMLLTYWTALALVSRRAAVLAAAMMAASVLLGVEARLATTDAMLLLAVVAAMGTLARAYGAGPEGAPARAPGPRVAATFWVALAGGVLLEGPVILVVVGLTVATLAAADRSVRWAAHLRPLAGIATFAVLVLPWFLAITRRAGDVFFESMAKDALARALVAREAHGAPPGTYLLLFWATFWPGAAVAGSAAPSVWASRREPATRSRGSCRPGSSSSSR